MRFISGTETCSNWILSGKAADRRRLSASATENSSPSPCGQWSPCTFTLRTVLQRSGFSAHCTACNVRRLFFLFRLPPESLAKMKYRHATQDLFSRLGRMSKCIVSCSTKRTSQFSSLSGTVNEIPCLFYMLESLVTLLHPVIHA